MVPFLESQELSLLYLELVDFVLVTLSYAMYLELVDPILVALSSTTNVNELHYGNEI